MLARTMIRRKKRVGEGLVALHTSLRQATAAVSWYGFVLVEHKTIPRKWNTLPAAGEKGALETRSRNLCS